MPTCSYCETAFWFGGKRNGPHAFCNEECEHRGALLNLIDHVPEDVVTQHIAAVHHGDCPQCGGSGPIDVHNSYRVWSALILTSWSTHPKICCVECAKSAQIKDAIFSLACGWWGLPWGLIITPIQISRNLIAIMSARRAGAPSPQFRKFIKLYLAQQIVDEYANGQQRSAA